MPRTVSASSLRASKKNSWLKKNWLLQLFITAFYVLVCTVCTYGIASTVEPTATRKLFWSRFLLVNFIIKLFSLIYTPHLNTPAFHVIFHQDPCDNPGSILFSGSTPRIDGVYSEQRPILYPSLVELCSVVFVSSCWKTNKPTIKQTNRQ